MSGLFDPSILNCVWLVAAADGTCQDLPEEGPVFLNCRNLSSPSALEAFCETFKDPHLADRVTGIDFSGANISDNSLSFLITNVIANLTNLIELNLSYIPLGHKSVPALCAVIDAKISGYCNLKRLILSKTGLDLKNCKNILDSCVSNIVLQQLVLNGNKSVRLCLSSIVELLSHPENRFHAVNLATCGIEAAGMAKFSNAIARHAFLRELQLSFNPLGEAGASVLFHHLAKSSGCLLEILYLDQCDLKACEWAEHIPSLNSLHTLSLSYNNITDSGLQELCRHIEKSFTLRHLSLASNTFGAKAICLGSLLQYNPGLLTLNISGNMLLSESADSIAFGILQNRTMLSINMSGCTLSPSSALKICDALMANELIDVNISHNPIDRLMQEQPRAYIKCHRSQQSGLNQGDAERDFDLLSFRALERAELWRAEQARIFEEVRMAAAIVGELGSNLVEEQVESNGESETEEVLGNGECAHRPKTAMTDGGTNDQPYEVTLDSSNSSVMMLRSSSMAGEAELERGKSSHGTSKSKSTRRRKHAEAEKGSVITVSYGPRTVVLGTINVPESASYADVRKLINPLVKNYFDNLKKSAEESGDYFPDVSGDKTDAFRMVDPDNLVLSREAEVSRQLLPELRGTEFHDSIVVRPISWLQLPEEEDENS